MVRVLVFTPTYDDMLRPETVASVEAQAFDGEFDYEIDDRDLSPGRSMRDVCVKYRDARQRVLDDGYDALLTVEHDMVLPDGCIQALWDTAEPDGVRLAPVVYAAYMLRHGRPVTNLFRKEGNKNIGMSLSLYPGELVKAKKRGVIQVSGAGMGCTLFRREGLEAVPFRVFEDKPPDLAFAGDCLRAGVLQMGRLDVACDHIDEEGRTLSIDDGFGIVVRVLALQNVTVSAGGASMPMKKDCYYSMPLVDAREHKRAGFVTITNEAEAADASPSELAESNDSAGRETAVAEDFETSEPPVVKRRKPRKRKPKTMSTKSV